MQLSPLQLLEYTFDGVSVIPVEGYVPDAAFAPGLVFFPGNLAISSETGVSLLDEKEKYSDFGVKLALHVGPKDDAQAPYSVDVSVRGVVRMHLVRDQDQANERRTRAWVNGASLLYGAIREMVSNVTSRSANGPFLLPSLNFSELANIPPDGVTQPAGSVSAPKPRKAPTGKKKANPERSPK